MVKLEKKNIQKQKRTLKNCDITAIDKPDICKLCNLEGHVKRNSIHYLFNPLNPNFKEPEINEKKLICPHCGIQGHTKKSHNNWLQNKKNSNFKEPETKII